MADASPSPLAAVLTTVGGAFILAGGLLLWLIGTVLESVFGFSSPVFFLGAILGLLTIGVGVAIGLLPRARRPLGAVALAFAVASIPLAWGGLVVGFVLTAVGGAIALSRPARRVVVVTTARPSRHPPPGS